MAKRPVTEPEEWRPVPDHPGYEASSLGRIRSVDRWTTYADGRQAFLQSVMLRLVPWDGKYAKASLGANRRIGAHIVVCTTFHGPRPSKKHHAAHWNGDQSDNRAANLRWATCKENQADKSRHGTSPMGSRNGMAKFTEADIRAIRKLRAIDRLSIQEIADRFGTHRVNVSRIVHRVIWKHVP